MLDEHERTNPSEFVFDTAIAEETRVELSDVRRQLDILADEGSVQVEKSSGGVEARILPPGMRLIEGIE
jgi:Fe2+ or Zn2+ uptake regulation protein